MVELEELNNWQYDMDKAEWSTLRAIWNDKRFEKLEAKLEKLETNHIAHIIEDIQVLKDGYKNIINNLSK